MIEICSLWDQINLSGNSEIEFIRISSQSITGLNIGLNLSGNRCLILELPRNYYSRYQSVRMLNLSLHILNKEGYIILELTNSYFIDLFNDLVLSLHNHICDVSDIRKCEEIFVSTFFKWSELFESNVPVILSEEMIKGLWGELFVLKEELETSPSVLLYNDILKTWRGPYNDGHDFVKDDYDIEVKTKEVTRHIVNIASEYQLSEELGKGLILLVLSVELNNVDGKSLKELVFEIKEILYEGNADLSILFAALLQKGITLLNIEEYNSYKYKPVLSKSYDCSKEGFPRIIKDNINTSIKKVSYSLLLTELEEFEIEDKFYK